MRAPPKLIGLLAVLAASDAVPAAAANFYFNKPQATLAMLQHDGSVCSAIVSGRSLPGQPVVARGATPAQAAANSAVASMAAGVIGGIMAAANQERALEMCLLVKGWRQIELSAAEDATLRKEVASDRDGTLAALVGIEPVVFGHIGRVWKNNYAEPHPLTGNAPTGQAQ